MKRKVIIIISACILLVLVGFLGTMAILKGINNKQDDNKVKSKSENKVEKDMVSLVLDYENMDDQLYNGLVWSTISEFAKEEGYDKEKICANKENSDASRKKAIDKAILLGADILVFVDKSYANLIGGYQKKYPDIHMLLVEFEPAINNKVSYEKNVTSVFMKKEEVGYLAGYVLVGEGYRKLGFYGAKKNEETKDYGYGLIQGAEAAAKKLGLQSGDIRLEFRYTGSYSPSKDIVRDAKQCYENGTEVIFSCAGNGLYSIIEAIDKRIGRKVVTSVVDNTSENENILFSAMLNIKDVVKDTLQDYVNSEKKWSQSKAGMKIEVGMRYNAVGLSAQKGSWRLRRVTIERYNSFYNSLRNANIKIYNDRLPVSSYVNVNMKEVARLER